MSGNNLKTHYSAKELVGLSLATLPNSVQGILYQAKKNCWATQKRVGKGGGVEYAVKSMPEHESGSQQENDRRGEKPLPL